MAPKPCDNAEAQRRIRKAAEAGNVEFTPHAIARIRDRAFTLPGVAKGLKSARVQQKGSRELSDGTWSYRVTGRANDRTLKAGVVLTGARALVVTVLS